MADRITTVYACETTGADGYIDIVRKSGEQPVEDRGRVERM